MTLSSDYYIHLIVLETKTTGSVNDLSLQNISIYTVVSKSIHKFTSKNLSQKSIDFNNFDKQNPE